MATSMTMSYPAVPAQISSAKQKALRPRSVVLERWCDRGVMGKAWVCQQIDDLRARKFARSFLQMEDELATQQ
jgi:hypothetical protein